MRILGKMIEYGLLGIILYVPFTFGLPNPRAQTIVNLLVILLLSLWLLGMNEKGRFFLVKTPLNIPLLLCLIILTVSALRASYLHHSLNELYRLTSAILLFFLVANNIVQEREVKRSVLLLLLVGNLVAAIGIFSYFRYHLSFAVATFPNHNLLAGYLVISLSLSLALLLFEKGPFFRKAPLLLSFILPLICLVLTKSRGGLLSLVGALTILIFFSIRGKKRWPLAILLGIILLLLLPPNPLVKRLIRIGKEDPHAYERLLTWDSTLRIIKDHPLFGVGLGSFGDYYPQYKIQKGFRSTRFAHNEYLHFTAELGLIGVILGLWLLSPLFKNGLSVIKREASGISLGILASLAGILVHSLVDFNLHTLPLTMTLAYLSGLSINLDRIQRQEPLLKQEVFKSQIFIRKKSMKRIIAMLIIIGLLGYLAVITRPYFAWLHYREAEISLREGEEEGALLQYQKAIALSPLCASYHKGLADLYQKRKELGNALREYKKAIELHPRNVFYHQALGKFYEKYELYEEAIAQYQEMIRLAPRVADFHLALVQVYQKKGWPDLASAQYQKILEFEPDNERALEGLKEMQHE